MKKKILALAFMALMILGLAQSTESREAYGNDWHCMGSYIWCGPGEVGHMALVCGDTGDERVAMYNLYRSMLCESVP